MKMLSIPRVKKLLDAAQKTRVLVIGDVMLDQFLWGRVSRISPEAPVPVVDFERESFMPGGAANVARNLADLKIATSIFGIVGEDDWAKKLKELLVAQNIGCDGVLPASHCVTSVKTRIVAHQQQVVRVDRETRCDLNEGAIRDLLQKIKAQLPKTDAVIVGDYGKGVVTQSLLDEIKNLCRARGIWLSLDPKPTHHLDLRGLSLITPNRKETFELTEIDDNTRNDDPQKDTALQAAADKLLAELQPALLLITLGDLGMLLCEKNKRPFHIPTVAKEVFDVSGAGDTVIASFTAAIAAGASPIEAAIFSNHAAGVVVGKVGTATVAPEELLASFGSHSR